MKRNLFSPSMPADMLRGLMSAGRAVAPGSGTARALREWGDRARWITSYLNCVEHEPHVVRDILRELTLMPVPDSVELHPPFYCSIGINLQIGHAVLIGQSSSLLDEGGIRLGDRAILDPGVVITTTSRSPRPAYRRDILPGRVVVEPDAWLGAGCVIMPGVVIGRAAIVLPGSVVMTDVPAGTVAGGAPAQYLREI